MMRQENAICNELHDRKTQFDATAARITIPNRAALA
jgi:hypothetical protein